MSSSSSTPRTCGRCTVCCTVQELPELNKPAGTPCVHLPTTLRERPRCCAYDKRPQACRDWSCLWLLGHGEEAHRPDNSGILLSAFHMHPEVTCILLREAWPGAFKDSALARAYADEIRGQGLLLLQEGDRQTLYGPPDQLERATRILTPPKREEAPEGAPSGTSGEAP